MRRAHAVGACCVLALMLAMLFWLKSPAAAKASLKEESAALLQQAKGVAVRTAEHANALAELFSAELKEYASCQIQRLIMLVLAAILLLGAYFLLCAFIVLLAAVWLGYIWATALVCLLNIALAVALLCWVRRLAGKQLAPATREELINDWQCLKLLIKENNKP